MTEKLSITRVMEFDAGHCLQSHLGFCKGFHGHRYRVELTVEGQLKTEGSERGMVKDFSFLKEALMYIHKIYDHGFIIENTDPRVKDLSSPLNKVIEVPFPPTVENLAAEIKRQLVNILPKDLSQIKIKMYETPNNWVEL